MSGPVAGTPEAVVTPAAPVRWVGYVLILCGVVILVVFAATINPGQLGAALHGARPSLLGLAVAAVGAQVLVKAVRWRYMVARLTGTVISVRFSVVSILAGVAAGSVTPARSFEVAKIMMLKGSYGTGLGLSTSAMLVERLLDIVLMIAAFLVAGLLLPRRMITASEFLLVLIAALIAGSIVLAAAPLGVRTWTRHLLRRLPMPAGVRARAVRLTDTLCESILVWRQGRTLGVLVLVTAVVTALDLARVCIVFWAMGTGLSPTFVSFTYVGAAMLGMALLVPGGVGVTEVSQVGLIALLAPHALPPVLARSAVLLDRTLSYYLPTLIGAALLMAYHRYRHVFR
ncbi:MAG TPA: lysylphosphatidylglycerol synthase transmembrane domain-containing protein [bacterium]|nr:lysylphosphatidylglycerol synthase transmembrane domain-containing protein [bacterium]